MSGGRGASATSGVSLFRFSSKPRRLLNVAWLSGNCSAPSSVLKMNIEWRESRIERRPSKGKVKQLNFPKGKIFEESAHKIDLVCSW